MAMTARHIRWVLVALSLPLGAADLAPTGTLRAAFLGLNPVQSKKDSSTGTIIGPVPDLVKELARRLNVSYKLLPEPDARHVVDDLNSHAADIGFLAKDPVRAQEVDFSEPYALMYNAYIVRADSGIQKAADADRNGLRIAAVRGQTQQIFLSGNLKNAQVKIFETMPPQMELLKLFENSEFDAFGVNRERAEAAAAQSSKLRALSDNFLIVEQSVIVRKEAASEPVLKELNAFLRDVRGSGFVKQSLDRAKIAGVAVPD